MSRSEFDPAHNDMKAHAASGFIFTAITQAVKILTQFFSVIVMARLLEPSDFGLVSMVSPIYGFALLFHDLGLSQATLQKTNLTTEQVNSFFWINTGSGLIICLVIIAMSPLVAWFYSEPRTIPLTIAMALLVFFGGLGNQHGALITRKMHFRGQSIINITSGLIALAGSIAWACFFPNYWALYAGMALGTILPVIGVWIIVKWRPQKPSFDPETTAMLKYGLGITGFNLINFTTQSANTIVIGRFLGERSLGLYDRAGRLLSAPLQQLTSPINGVIFPILYRLHSDDQRYRRTFLRAICSITVALSPGVVWAIVMASPLVTVFLGSKWQEASLIFAALSFTALPQLINGMASWLFMTQGRTAELSRWSACDAIFSLITLAAGVPFGIFGIAMAAALSQLVRTPFLWWYACRTGPVTVANLVTAIIPQAAACATAFVFLEAFNILYRSASGPSKLIVGVLLSYAVALAVITAFPAGREALRQDIGFAKFLLLQIIRKTEPLQTHT